MPININSESVGQISIDGQTVQVVSIDGVTCWKRNFVLLDGSFNANDWIFVTLDGTKDSEGIHMQTSGSSAIQAEHQTDYDLSKYNSIKIYGKREDTNVRFDTTIDISKYTGTGALRIQYNRYTVNADDTRLDVDIKGASGYDYWESPGDIVIYEDEAPPVVWEKIELVPNIDSRVVILRGPDNSGAWSLGTAGGQADVLEKITEGLRMEPENGAEAYAQHPQMMGGLVDITGYSSIKIILKSEYDNEYYEIVGDLTGHTGDSQIRIRYDGGSPSAPYVYLEVDSSPTNGNYTILGSFDASNWNDTIYPVVIQFVAFYN